MLYTTLNKIRALGPCGIENETPRTRFRKRLVHSGKTKPDDEPVPFAEILKSNGIEDALWCLRSIDEPVFCRLLAVRFAREVQHLMQDPRSLAVLDVAERYARGEASAEELAKARSEAWNAHVSATAAYSAAAYAAYSAAAYAAAYAAYAAAYAAYAAYGAAAAYAAYAVGQFGSEDRTKMRERQAEIFLEMLKL